MHHGIYHWGCTYLRVNGSGEEEYDDEEEEEEEVGAGKYCKTFCTNGDDVALFLNVVVDVLLRYQAQLGLGILLTRFSYFIKCVT